MLKVNKEEQKYAFLRKTEGKDTNRYGDNIEMVSDESELRNESLCINGDDGIGENPNRYKQHGFYLNADNCIGCHACEAACSEKNDNPAHIAFRSVGFVEGGTYPDYQRINISMACNHCDDPVCLKGCPTRAYTKFAEYGAVLQDPDICFGCGYCTWVCPYNAPQMDPEKGQVSKCNMCVDRLEVGLKPSCVSACLGNALDFGVVEDIPENRQQAEAEIPGFPKTDITHPNIRFQQTKQTHREMTRTDSIPIKYHRDTTDNQYKPTVDEKAGQAKYWNLKSLLTSHESAHVIFTLCTQASVGTLLLLMLMPALASEFDFLQTRPMMLTTLVMIFVLSSVGLYKLNMHLGKPHRFYRGFNNLRLSPVSREIAGVSLFYGFLMAALGLEAVGLPMLSQVATGLSVLSGMIGLYFMYRLYRIPARPFWDHKQTGFVFLASMLGFGAMLMALMSLLMAPAALESGFVQAMSMIVSVALLIEAAGHLMHAKDMKKQGDEGAASYYRQTTQYGKSYLFRNLLLAINIGLALLISVSSLDKVSSSLLLMLLFFSMTVMAVFGRSLFFVLVIPTTMPGAFFWKNEGFVDHARETGLADMPQVGVVYERHHAFKVDELIETIKENSIKDMIDHVRWIFGAK